MARVLCAGYGYRASSTHRTGNLVQFVGGFSHLEYDWGGPLASAWALVFRLLMISGASTALISI
jgi:hypothetical protein